MDPERKSLSRQNNEPKESRTRILASKTLDAADYILTQKYVHLLGLADWIANIGYNRYWEHQDWWRSVAHGPGQFYEGPTFDPTFAWPWGPLGHFTQSAMIPVTFIWSAALGYKIINKALEYASGQGTPRVRDHVIYSECEGISLYDDLAALIDRSQLQAPTVLAKTDPRPEKRPEERRFRRWVANQGTADSELLDIGFWKRAGADKAKAIVMNHASVHGSREAAKVIKEQLGNEKVRILALALKSHQVHEIGIDPKTGIEVISPYVETAKQIIEGVRRQPAPDADRFITRANAHLMAESYRLTLTTKREDLLRKLSAFSGDRELLVYIFKPQPMHGVDRHQLAQTEEEYKGFLNAFKSIDGCTVLTKKLRKNDPLAKQVKIAVYPGCGEIWNDLSITRDYPDDPFESGNYQAVRMGIPFRRRNEGVVLGHMDGVLSMKRALNNTIFRFLLPDLHPTLLSRLG